jgi:hypothetical protein
MRSALLLPMPGKPDKACTAFSTVFDEKFKVWQNYINIHQKVFTFYGNFVFTSIF